jgi:hypothetical protein
MFTMWFTHRNHIAPHADKQAANDCRVVLEAEGNRTAALTPVTRLFTKFTRRTRVKHQNSMVQSGCLAAV